MSQIWIWIDDGLDGITVLHLGCETVVPRLDTSSAHSRRMFRKPNMSARNALNETSRFDTWVNATQ